MAQAARKEARKVASLLEKSSKKRFVKNLMRVAAPQIIDVVMSDYDARLVSAVTDRKSRTRPELYRETFESRLGSFEFIRETEKGIALRTPDMDNFDFSGQLKIVENILNGTAGVYVEVDEEQYIQMYDRQPRRTDLFDQDLPKKQRIYLLRFTMDVRNRLMNNNIDMVRFPFSNTPSIDIFSSADNMVVDNMGEWIDDIITDSIKDLSTTYGRR